MVKAGLKARGDGCTKVVSSGRDGLGARGVGIFKTGRQDVLAATTTDAEGVATFVLRRSPSAGVAARATSAALSTSTRQNDLRRALRIVE